MSTSDTLNISSSLPLWPGPPPSSQANNDRINQLLKVTELAYLIFSLTTNLSECAAVSRQWKTIIYNPLFQQRILPADRCGAAEWMRCLKIIINLTEPRVPLDFFKEPGLQLMLVLESFETEEKEIIETSDLISLEKVFDNPRTGKK